MIRLGKSICHIWVKPMYCEPNFLAAILAENNVQYVCMVIFHGDLVLSNSLSREHKSLMRINWF